MMKFSRIILIIVLFFMMLSVSYADRPVFDVIHHHNSTMFFNLTELGYTQDTIDLVNRSVMDGFQFWNQPGFALITDWIYMTFDEGRLLLADKEDTSLFINKMVNATNVYVGDLIRYTIQVENLGSNPVTSIKVNDTLPGSLEFVSSDSNNSGGDTIPYLWNIPLLSSGESATLNIVCKVKQTGTTKNTASLIINNYENNLTNSSSVDITAVDHDNSTNSTNSTDNDVIGDGGLDRFGDGLSLSAVPSAVPLVALVLAIVGGVYYYRKK